jgi:hypothetical protein
MGKMAEQATRDSRREEHTHHTSPICSGRNTAVLISYLWSWEFQEFLPTYVSSRVRPTPASKPFAKRCKCVSALILTIGWWQS